MAKFGKTTWDDVFLKYIVKVFFINQFFAFWRICANAERNILGFQIGNIALQLVILFCVLQKTNSIAVDDNLIFIRNQTAPKCS